jgi:hypothetical protein
MIRYLRSLAIFATVGISACGMGTIDAGEEAFVDGELAYPYQQGTPGTGTFVVEGQPRQLTYREIDGEAVFEGDIILGTVGEDGVREDGLAAVTASKLWANATIPYTIVSNLPKRNRVTDAIAHWHAKTKVRLVPRTNQRDYVTFTTGSGCSSSVGRVGGRQYIRLASGCSTGNVVHEIGHAAGVWHEQARADRDQNVRVLWNNIQSGSEHNFQTYLERGNQGRDVGEYDVLSIMHYGSTAFSRNGRPTITRLDGSTFQAQRSALTAKDIAGIAILYP